MKKLVFLFSIMLIGNVAIAKVSFKDLSPKARIQSSQTWLAVGQQFKELGKDKKAIASLKYCNELYPMGKSAESARALLYDAYNVIVKYSPDLTYKSYMDRAKKVEGNLRLNNYFMALEVYPTDIQALYKTGETYLSMGKKSEAIDYLKKAISRGYKFEDMSQEAQEALGKVGKDSKDSSGECGEDSEEKSEVPADEESEPEDITEGL